ncbi:hypothetical protein PIB30_088687, partial [Stylosanthes scabra]|nr:hypothetical protein [Stylosanthes scabra]
SPLPPCSLLEINNEEEAQGWFPSVTCKWFVSKKDTLHQPHPIYIRSLAIGSTLFSSQPLDPSTFFFLQALRNASNMDSQPNASLTDSSPIPTVRCMLGII